DDLLVAPLRLCPRAARREGRGGHRHGKRETDSCSPCRNAHVVLPPDATTALCSTVCENRAAIGFRAPHAAAPPAPAVGPAPLQSPHPLRSRPRHALSGIQAQIGRASCREIV